MGRDLSVTTELLPEMWAAPHMPSVSPLVAAFPVGEVSPLSREPVQDFFCCHSVMNEIITACNQGMLYDDQQSDQSA